MAESPGRESPASETFNGRRSSRRRRPARQMNKSRGLNKNLPRNLRASEQPPDDDRENRGHHRRRHALREERDRAHMLRLMRVAMQVLVCFRAECEKRQHQHHRREQPRHRPLKRTGLALALCDEAFHSMEASRYNKRVKRSSAPILLLSAFGATAIIRFSRQSRSNAARESWRPARSCNEFRIHRRSSAQRSLRANRNWCWRSRHIGRRACPSGRW